MRAARYETIGAGYARTRREDPRLRARIHAALGDARTVVNVGAGAGSYEPRDRHVIAIEPSDVMAAQRPPELAPAIRGTADDLPLRDDAVDAAMAVLTVHHWDAGLERGVRELRRVARGPVVIVTYDAAVSGGWWLMRDYLPEVAAMDHRIFPPLDRLAGGSAGTSPSTRWRWRPTRRTGRSAPSGRIPGACSTPRRGPPRRGSRGWRRRSWTGWSAPSPPTSTAVRGTPATGRCARSRSSTSGAARRDPLRGGFARGPHGQRPVMAAERDGDPRDRDPDEIGELVDEFGDRSGPDPAREPEVEPLAEDEPIVEPARDDPDAP